MPRFLVSSHFKWTEAIFPFFDKFIRNDANFRLRQFPPKARLLSSEEFHAQSVLETTKALEELKAFCNSPESKPWRMMTRLKDPQRFVADINSGAMFDQQQFLRNRFASFIEGDSHLMDDEILDYETTQIERDDDLNTDDEDDDLMTDSDSDK